MGEALGVTEAWRAQALGSEHCECGEEGTGAQSRQTVWPAADEKVPTSQALHTIMPKLLA